uniref:Ras-related protein Rab-39B-like n=1 Tax=Sinocyclocheilus anshuiensis TaxID=1608454 RepID=A0A671MV45_9TELE
LQAVILTSLLILGDSSVGKSSLLHRFTEGTFDESRQERFRSICKSYMRNSVGCILMFDVSQRQTFDRVGSWQQEVLDYVKPNPMFFVLVGHKCDLAVGRKVRKSEGDALAKKLNMLAYLEVSTKENINVSEVFETLTRGIYNLFQQGKIPTRDDWQGLTVGATIKKESDF